MVVFSRGPTVLPLTIAFDLHLHWDDETIEAARDRVIDLKDISGWMSIEYDAEASSLLVTVIDDAGGKELIEYAVGPHSDTEEAHAAFDAHLRLFFDYMNGGNLLGEVGGAGSTTLSCGGGSCNCSYPPDCTFCSACCPNGFIPDCNCTPPNCRCTCTLIQKV
jgi:hypothetical protein